MLPALDMQMIADLSDATLGRLTRDELIQLIDAAAVAVRLASSPGSGRLQLRDIETLRRLAHLARFACRNLIRCRSLNSP
jgi:hypothetical protein